jgi:hypothetical protein
VGDRVLAQLRMDGHREPYRLGTIKRVNLDFSFEITFDDCEVIGGELRPLRNVNQHRNRMKPLTQGMLSYAAIAAGPAQPEMPPPPPPLPPAWSHTVSPLLAACAQGRTAVARALIDAGAGVDELGCCGGMADGAAGAGASGSGGGGDHDADGVHAASVSAAFAVAAQAAVFAAAAAKQVVIDGARAVQAAEVAKLAQAADAVSAVSLQRAAQEAVEAAAASARVLARAAAAAAKPKPSSRGPGAILAPLHAAAAAAATETVQLLLERGADVTQLVRGDDEACVRRAAWQRWQQRLQRWHAKQQALQ